MTPRILVTLLVLLFILATKSLEVGSAYAEEIRRWVDPEGNLHFSNVPEGPIEEKVEEFEESRAAEDAVRAFVSRTRSAISSLEFKLYRLERELKRRHSELVRARDVLVLVEQEDPEDLPMLRLRERRATSEVEALEKEISELRSQIGKLRALQALGEAEGR